MNECQIGDNGASAIAEGYARNIWLTHIHLRNNDITDKPGWEILMALKFQSNLLISKPYREISTGSVKPCEQPAW